MSKYEFEGLEDIFKRSETENGITMPRRALAEHLALSVEEMEARRREELREQIRNWRVKKSNY